MTTNLYHAGINSPQSDGKRQILRCVISVATKLRLQTTSLNLEPLLGSMPQHGKGYCTIAQTATGKLGIHQSLPTASTSSHRHLSTKPASEALEAETRSRCRSKVRMGITVQLRLTNLPHHRCRTLPAEHGGVKSLYPDLLKSVGGTACHLLDTAILRRP